MEEEKIESSEFNQPEISENPTPLPWVEKNGFSHAAMAIGWVIVALVAFNIVGAIAGIIGAFFVVEDPTDIQNVLTSLAENVNILFLANTAGQVFVMAIGTLLLVKLSAVKGKRMDFLRIKITSNVWQVTLIGLVLVASAYPTVTFLGWLNSFLPAPEWMMEMQQTMAEMISKFLKSENAILLGLIHIGFVPAICEEIMYRGYIQRSLERSKGVWFGIIVSGIIFGAYHLQITNILPLATLGILFAYITYIADSIIPAMFAHLLNNGGQVILSSFYPEMLDESITPESEMPWLLIIGSMVITSALIYLLHKMKPVKEEV